MKSRVYFLALIGMVCFVCSCKRARTLDILAIMDKSPEEVEAVLGKPDTSFTQVIVTKQIFTQIYDIGCDLEIMYPNGLSTDIVVLDGASLLAFEPSVITRFGLEARPPTDVLKNAYFKWKDYPGFETINLFATDLDSTGAVEQFNLFFKSELGRTKRRR